jgi:hypothetical protein
MKKVIRISVAVVLASGVLQAESTMKKYSVKSAKIEYSIKGSGNILGIETKTIGKKRLIFDNYGVKELQEESQVNKTKGWGKNEVKKNHTMQYMNDLILYKVNFKKKKINRGENHGASMAVSLGGKKNLEEGGEAMLKNMGGKKIGTDKVAGYDCDVWKITGSKQCIYKGVPLRTETNIMGIKSIEIATKAEFGLSLGEDDFKLPDFPIYDQYGKKIETNTDNLDELDKKETVKIAQKNKKSSSDRVERRKRAQETMQVGLVAAQKEGYKGDKLFGSKVKMTKKQEEAAAKAMDEYGFPMRKESLINEEQGMIFAKKCLSKIDAKDTEGAFRCIDKAEKELDVDIEYNYKWNAKIKKDILADIDIYLEKILPCAKKSSTSVELNICIDMDEKED